MRLIDCFTEALAYAWQALENAQRGEPPSYDDLRVGVEQRLAEHAGSYLDGGYSEAQYQAAKFPVIALIDEMVLDSDWPHKTQWQKELLQASHFNTANGGAEFYERLHELNPFNPAESDIREVYFYCLSLGFQGRYYRPEDRHKLDALRNETFQALTGARDKPAHLEEATLFPNAFAEPLEPEQLRARGGWTPLLYGAPLVLLLVAYSIFRLDIAATAGQLLEIL